MDSAEIQRVRQDTPGCQEIRHFNNAGASLPPRQVTETVIEHLRAEERRGGYEATAAASDRVEAVYDSLARMLNAAPEDIALTDSATRSWQAIFYAIEFAAGDRILTCRSEYASNAIAYLQVAKRTGAIVEVVDDDQHGQLDVEDLKRRIDGSVKLISISHVPTQGGLVNPAEAVGEVAAAAGIPYLLDACQSAGQLDLDVERLRCDALTAAGRKYLRGPRGTGFLYARPSLRERLEPAMLDLHSAVWTAPDTYEVVDSARRFEAWERSTATVLGLGAAVDYALGLGLRRIEARVAALGEMLRTRLREIDAVTVHDLGERRCGIVTFSVDGLPSPELNKLLAGERVNTSVTYRESAQYDFTGRDLPVLARASVHYYNTEAEIDTLAQLVSRFSRR
ncbi:aminotransferase class V-fold PLP-dependent enzyme [Amycolatopsis minnesotensis]|uniref:Aminotransferase class V-fold PLP-dependent enzyme n=1 Tax=Amycolatopsis minnesotensis TaxID=337894 RepID=A0ABN2SH47_9PSEU